MNPHTSYKRSESPKGSIYKETEEPSKTFGGFTEFVEAGKFTESEHHESKEPRPKSTNGSWKGRRSGESWLGETGEARSLRQPREAGEPESTELEHLSGSLKSGSEKNSSGPAKVREIEPVASNTIERNHGKTKETGEARTTQSEQTSVSGNTRMTRQYTGSTESTKSTDPNESTISRNYVSFRNSINSVESHTFPTEDPENPIDYPIDGAFAIWQASLTFLLSFLTWGANASFGVFLNFYMSHNLFPGATNLDFALIGGLLVLFGTGLAPLTWFSVAKLGHRKVLMIGLFVQTAGYILASFSTKLWQIYLTQGVLVGMSINLLFILGTLMIPLWFDKRKSTAMGICVSGLGMGGLVFSLAMNKVILDTNSQRWPLRITGIVTFAATLIAICFLRPRRRSPTKTIQTAPNQPEVKKPTIFNFTLFRSSHFLALGVWYGVGYWSYVICLYTFPAYATSVGLTHSQANNLLAVVNAAQVVGRPALGNFADYAGRTNAAAFACVYTAVLVLGFWRNVTSYGALMALSVLLGLLVGHPPVMCQSLGADILDVQGTPQLMPAAWSNLNILVAGFGFSSEVIAIALKDDNAANPYDHTQVFTGCVLLLGFVVLLFNREYIVRRLLENKEKEERQYGRDRFLRRSLGGFLTRMFYPMRV